jgi:hypothetical protein
VPSRHSDDLFRFSYRIFKIEYIIVKLLFLAFSLFGLYKLAQQEFGFNRSPAHATEPSTRAPSASSRSVPATPQKTLLTPRVAPPAASP